MKTIKLLSIILAAGLVIWSCDQDLIVVEPGGPDDPTVPEVPSAGTLDFTNHVAMGNSLMTGFIANALFDDGQAASLPAILHTQLAATGAAGDFIQPDINHPVGYNATFSDPANGIFLGRMLLQGDPPLPTPQPSDIGALPDPTLNPGFIYTGDQVNNFAVPGIQTVQMLIPETGDWANSAHPAFNPFYARFAAVPGTSTILTDVLATNPTFFSLWIGNNDVLGFAATGGAGSIGITDPAEYDLYMQQIVGALMTNPEVEGVIANIPNIPEIPYFNFIGWNAVTLTQADADLANFGFAGYNQFLDGLALQGFITQAEADKRKVSWAAGPNGALIDDETLTDITPFLGGLPPEDQAALGVLRIARQATEADLIPLTAAAVLGTEAAPGIIFGVSFPLEDQYVLIEDEVMEVEDAVDAYNTTISGFETAYPGRIAIADVNGAVSDLVADGSRIENNIAIDATFFPPTGLWSEDAVHPNSRGYAFAANAFIDAINAKWGANGTVVPRANLADYSATGLPIP